MRPVTIFKSPLVASLYSAALLSMMLAACGNETPPTDTATHEPASARPARPEGLLAAGTQAPELNLRDQHGQVRRLEEFRGKNVVLYFYPRDGTPGCTVEARGFRDARERLDGAGAVVIGVSTDDVSDHAEFASNEDLPFILLSDGEASLAARYGVNVTLGFASRVTFVIDGTGTIRRVFPDVDPSEHADEVLATLAELRSVQP